MEGGNFLLRVPLKGADYFTTVRLAVGGICAMAGADLDAAEDFKVCVTEALLILKRGGSICAEISFEIDDGVKANVKCVSRGEEASSDDENEISLALLGALVDDATYTKDGGEICEIDLFKSV